ncbi:hypothetical protein D3C80_1729800 [compost metagenome]
MMGVRSESGGIALPLSCIKSPIKPSVPLSPLRISVRDLRSFALSMFEFEMNFSISSFLLEMSEEVEVRLSRFFR